MARPLYEDPFDRRVGILQGLPDIHEVQSPAASASGQDEGQPAYGVNSSDLAAFINQNVRAAASDEAKSWPQIRMALKRIVKHQWTALHYIEVLTPARTRRLLRLCVGATNARRRMTGNDISPPKLPLTAVKFSRACLQTYDESLTKSRA